MTRTIWGVAAALVFVAGTVSAQAQNARRTVELPAVDISRLDLNASGRDSLLVNTGRLNEAGNLRFGVTGLYLNQPSVTRLGAGTGNARLSERYAAIASVAWTPNEWVELYGNAPFILYQGEMSSLSRFGFREVDTTGVGQPLVGARVGILKQGDMPVNLGVGFATTLPVGEDRALAGEPRVRFQPSLSVGRDLGNLVVGAQIGARLRSQENFAFRGVGAASNTNDTVRHEMTLGITAGYKVMEKLRANLDILADFSMRESGNTIQPFLSARYEVLKGMEAYAGAGLGFGSLVGTPRHQVLAGLAFTGLGGGGSTTQVKEEPKKDEPKKVVDPGTLDDDNDGIANRSDQCPKQAEDKDGFQDSDGCPDEDNDTDGVPDSKDACPDAKGAAENAGCPPKDADKDGVADVADRCPNEPGEVAEGGCPVRDTDKDGVRDEQDVCPNEAGTKEDRGCPVKDTDGDGVSDNFDNCLKEKGTKENAGCPAKTRQLVTITREKLVISDKVYFTPGKSTIMPKSRVLLDQVAKILKEHPEIPKLRVEGHTDNVGIPEKNMKLSDDRAKSVQAYLVKAGVTPTKLESVGFGQDKPIADNNTAQGRETNRRVEFVIIDAPDKVDSKVEPVPLK